VCRCLYRSTQKHRVRFIVKTYLFLPISICMSIYLSIYLYLPNYLLWLSISLFICLFVCLSIYLSKKVIKIKNLFISISALSLSICTNKQFVFYMYLCIYLFIINLDGTSLQCANGTSLSDVLNYSKTLKCNFVAITNSASIKL